MNHKKEIKKIINKKKKRIALFTCLISLVLVCFSIPLFLLLFDNNNNNDKAHNIGIKFETTAKAKLRTIFIDVGQADAHLIQVAKNGDFTIKDETFNILIDSGNYKSETNSQSDGWNTDRDDYVEMDLNTPSYNQKLKWTLESYLMSDGTRDLIDLFIFSHADADHIGGADDVLNDWAKDGYSKVLSFGNNNKDSSIWKRTLETIAENKLTYIDPFLNESLNTPIFKSIFSQHKYYYDNGVWNYDNLIDIDENTILVDFGDNKFFSYICPSYDYKITGDGLNEVNESSINNYLKWYDHTFLFTGDSTGTTHQDVIKVMNSNDMYKNNDGSLAVSYYKSAHHGSTTDDSNNVEFLKQIINDQTKVIIPTNDNKLYSGTPTFNTKSMQNLISAGIGELNIYTTQDHGDILVNIDPFNNDFSIMFFSRLNDLNDWKNLNGLDVATNHSKNYNNPKFNKYFAQR